MFLTLGPGNILFTPSYVFVDLRGTLCYNNLFVSRSIMKNVLVKVPQEMSLLKYRATKI